MVYNHFNPRSREGSDAGLRVVWRGGNLFQSTLPRGERLADKDTLDRTYAFQSTLPRGERLPSVQPPLPRDYDFNPRSREGSDVVSTVTSSP